MALYPGAMQIRFLGFQVYSSIVGDKALVTVRSNWKTLGKKEMRGREPGFRYLTHLTSTVTFSDVLTCLSSLPFPNLRSNTKGFYPTV